jgi:DNA repair exonuclease SbcCD ATPase subunit
MKVIGYEAHNVLRISDIQFDLEGRHLFLVGGANAQGKTSALTALLMALCGRSGMDYPEVALKEGEDRGSVKVQLSGDEDLQDDQGFTVELSLRRKRSGVVVEEFRVLDSSGEEAPEPRTLLKRLYNLRAFDPLAFERLDRKGKKELLQKMIGLDFSEQDKKYKRLYEERAAVNRDLSRLEARIEGMPKHADAPKEEVSTSDLLVELDRCQEQNNANNAVRQSLEGAKNQQAQYEYQLAEIQRQIQELTERLERGKEVVKQTAETVASLEAQAKELKDADVQEVKDRINNVDTVNRKVRDNRLRAEETARLNEFQKKAEGIESQMQAIASDKEKAIKEAQFPVAGLGFDDDGVTLNGLPFEQGSKKERIMTSVAIGMALQPKLRLMVCQDGSDLDSDTLAALDYVLVKNDYQMLLEIVTRTSEDEDRCAVVIKDGAVAKKN